jgi:predicted amidohydrolase YtcJ
MPRLRVRAERIWTADATVPSARALIVHDGRIESFEGMQAERELDGGPWVGPAFIDAHLHMTLGGLALSQCDLSACASRDAFAASIGAAHQALPPGRWLRANGWDQSRWGGPMPTTEWLHACGDRPAIAWRMDQHACVLNHAALALTAARFDLRTDPPGGRVERDGEGRPTGLFLEQAAWKWAKACVPEPTVQERREGLRAAGLHLARHGIATVGSMEYARDLVEAMDPLRRELPLRVRATLLDREWPLDWNLANCITRDEGLAIIGFKTFVDGTLGSRTARMLEPWADRPGDCGLLMELAERGTLAEWMREGLRRDFSMSLHVIGDAALRAALDAADAAERRGTPAREALRLEHAQTIHPDDLPRMKGRWASMQPLHKHFDAPGAPAALGEARMDRFFPFRSLAEHGAMLAFGSDWPIVPPDVIAGMRTAITGLDVGGDPCRPDDNLSPEAALRAFTIDAARCLRCNGRTGRLAPGLSADLVSLDRDPMRCNWVTDPPRVRWCMHAGQVTFVA